MFIRAFVPFVFFLAACANFERPAELNSSHQTYSPLTCEQEGTEKMVIQDVCPGEKCVLGQGGPWTSHIEAAIYDEPEGHPLSERIQPGDKLEVLRGIMVTCPRPMRVLDPGDKRYTGRPFKKGDVVYALYSLGEGAMRVLYEGQITYTGMDTKLTLVRPQNPDGLYGAVRNQWWVQVKTLSGQLGWIAAGKGFDTNAH